MSATDVKYGTVTLSNCKTRQFEQSAVYDESDTDRIGTKFRLQFECTLHVDDNVPTVAVTKEGQQFAQTAGLQLEAVRRELLLPRQRLTVIMNEKHARPMLDILPPKPDGKATFDEGQTTDIANGPRPLSLDITHIAGGGYYRVQWSVEATRGEVLSAGQSNDTILSNRWSVSETIDDAYYTTRTIRGRLRLASALRPAHKDKGMIILPLEDGFKRQAINFIESANGLDCDYEVIDKQVHTAAPWPAVKMDATYRQMTTDGVTLLSECNVKLVGAPASDKKKLLDRAIHIIEAKLGLILNDPDREDVQYQLVNSYMMEHIGESNVVEAGLTIKHVFDIDTISTSAFESRLANLTARIGDKLVLDTLDGKEYNPQRSWAPGTFGYGVQAQGDEAERLRSYQTAGLTAITCYLQDVVGNDGVEPRYTNDPNHSIGFYRLPDGEGDAAVQRGTTTDNLTTTFAGSLSGVSSTVPTADGDGERLPTLSGVITQGELPKSKKEGKWNENNRQGIYTVARADSDYYTEEGKVQFPVTADTDNGDTHAIVRLARPTARRRIRIEAERVGKWPELPTPEETYTEGESSDAITGTLISRRESPVVATVSPDGKTPIYSITLELIYALSRKPTNTETTGVGVLPNFTLTADDTDLVRSEIYTGTVTI